MSSQPKILVVDDEPEIRTILREMLEHAGNEVTAVADGEQAWSFLDATDQDFSAIVLDRKMPGLDGISLLRRIKGDGRLDCIPVIMVTGYPPNGNSETLRSMQVAGWLYKPVTLDQLGRLVFTTLRARQVALEPEPQA